MTLTLLLLFGLATWRIANMLVSEPGPFHVFFHIRRWSGIVHDMDGMPFSFPERFLPQLLSCVWCTSVWTGAGWALFWFLWPSVAEGAAILFAFSTVAIIVDKFVKG